MQGLATELGPLLTVLTCTINEILQTLIYHIKYTKPSHLHILDSKSQSK
jgi:hypothetical protein